MIGVLSLVTLFGSWVISYTTFKVGTDYRLQTTEQLVKVNAQKIEQMEQYGHPDHERRIAKLESLDQGKLAVELNEHTKQITALAEICKQDHDTLIKVVTLLEDQAKTNRQKAETK